MAKSLKDIIDSGNEYQIEKGVRWTGEDWLLHRVNQATKDQIRVDPEYTPVKGISDAETEWMKDVNAASSNSPLSWDEKGKRLMEEQEEYRRDEELKHNATEKKYSTLESYYEQIGEEGF